MHPSEMRKGFSMVFAQEINLETRESSGVAANSTPASHNSIQGSIPGVVAFLHSS